MSIHLYMQNKVNMENNTKHIIVKVSKYNDELAIIKVEKKLYWSNGTAYTLEDYVIFNESKNRNNKPY